MGVSSSEVLSRLLAIESELSAVKDLYSERDALTLDLMRMGFKGELMPDGTEVRLVDNYAEKNTAFRVAFIRRFEVEFIDPETARKRREKAEKKARSA